VLETTRGIFLHAVKYSETSLIASIYTEAFGRQSFLIKGVRNKNSAVKAAIFQPLYLLDLEIYYRPGKEMQWIKNARIALPYQSVAFDVRKSSQVIFLAEILNKCVREEEPNQELFNFLFHTLTYFDLTDSGISNFHLWFLFRLTHFLGIFPNGENSGQGTFFDLQKAQFVFSEPAHAQFADKRVTALFSGLFNSELNTLGKLNFTHADRSALLEMLLDFYRIHFDHLGDIKSLEVLKEIFR
jgi:DNA repair protein RecO (recombination protein O)